MKPANLILATLVSFALIFSSCSDDEKNCGGEDNERFAYFPSMTPSVFAQYNLPGKRVGNLYLATIQTNLSGTAKFAFSITVDSVCPYETILVSPTLVLQSGNPALTDSLYIESPAGNELHEAILPSNDVVYQVDEVYGFTLTPDKVKFTMFNSITFPSQGSRSADSLYFWSNLDTYTFSVRYKRTK